MGTIYEDTFTMGVSSDALQLQEKGGTNSELAKSSDNPTNVMTSSLGTWALCDGCGVPTYVDRERLPSLQYSAHVIYLLIGHHVRARVLSEVF